RYPLTAQCQLLYLRRAQFRKRFNMSARQHQRVARIPGMDVEKRHDEVALEDRTRWELAGEDSTKDARIHASPPPTGDRQLSCQRLINATARADLSAVRGPSDATPLVAASSASERSERATGTERAPQRERVTVKGSPRGEAPRMIWLRGQD